MSCRVAETMERVQKIAEKKSKESNLHDVRFAISKMTP